LTRDDLEVLLRALQATEAAGGPDTSEYGDTLELFERIAHHRGAAYYNEMVSPLLREGTSFSSLETMHGFVCLKPHGYAGDYEIIDRIYQGHRSSRWQKWDDFFHACDAPQAVVGRKDYFKGMLDQLETTRPAARILNVASGPCRDLQEYRSSVTSALSIHCVDSDSDAVEYAQMLLGKDAGVTFQIANALRLKADEFDLVWCAGLFDYLDNRTAVALLKRLLRLAPRGEVVVGNFSPATRARAYMEFGDWKLFYRSADDLLRLGERAGAPRDSMSVEQERTGVNLFLRVRVGA
jgi:extracellular factor (EF) 3-hydroxypalmitic acid methyl ester biosynthesis protein